jgi:hypothetical protein
LILSVSRLDDATTLLNRSLPRSFFSLEISMTQILKGRFDTRGRGSRTADPAKPPAPEFSAERYHLDNNGRRVLVGLTSAETHEFETLDALAPSDSSGDHLAWTFGGEPTTGREKRWLQLYTKHDEAWKSLRGKHSN